MKETITPAIITLHDLLDYDASRFMNAEIHLRNSLPAWINSATSIKLKEVLLKYQDYVTEHIERLDKFIEEEEISSLSTMNRVMHAFADEIREKLTHCRDYEVKDACLLAGIQAINHFKISAYGTAAAFAKTLGMERTAALFHEAEVNEKQIDDRLSQLAEFEVNKRAMAPIALEE